MIKSINWTQTAHRLRVAIAGMAFKERERRTLNFLVAATVDRGMAVLRLPSFDCAWLRVLTGLDRHHAHTVFGDLSAARVILMQDLGQGMKEVELQADHSAWSVLPLEHEARTEAAWAAMVEFNRRTQADLLEPPPMLDRARSEVARGSPVLPNRQHEVVAESATGVVAHVATPRIESNTRKPSDAISIRSNRGVAESATWQTDGYIMDKLSRAAALRLELAQMSTGTALDFAAFYARNPSRCREIISLAVDRARPGAWLNTVLANEMRQNMPREQTSQ